MAWDKTRLALRLPTLLLPFLTTHLLAYIRSLLHTLTYTPVPSPLNIVIIGGSFTGAHLAKRLSNSIPSGHKVVLIEKNSHFNYTFNFPRYSVLRGREERAFIPYTGLIAGAPRGALTIVHGTVVGVEEGFVIVNLNVGNMTGDGNMKEEKIKIAWDYLAIATGSTSPLPAKVAGKIKEEGRRELRGLQERIAGAERIAVVGGGAVGVQLVADVRSWYPETQVTLVHSRERLMSAFGERLGVFVREKLVGMGIRVVLGERPMFGDGETELRFRDGRVEEFDLVVRCTGQTPNTAFLSNFAPSSISPVTGRILVQPTLQIAESSSDAKAPLDTKIFALGDVAETSGAKMARAGMQQAEIASSNILSLIKNKSTSRRTKLKEYVPNYTEGSLKLSLGKDGMVIYIQDGEEDFLIPGKGLPEDLSVKQAWWMFGVSMKDCEI